MSFGPPRDGRANPFAVKKAVHRLAERFPRHPDDVSSEARTDSLKRRLRAHLYSPSAGLSWLDALFYDRLFCDRVAPPGHGADTGLLWSPTTESLELLIRTLDQQAAVRDQCLMAISKRNTLLENILTHSCYGARQVEARERELHRELGSSPLKGGTQFTFEQMWPADLLRNFLRRVSIHKNTDWCLHHRERRVECSVESHVELSRMLEALDAVTDEVVCSVIRWRMHLQRPQPFHFEGHNVLLMIQNDLETIIASVTAHLTDQSGGQAHYNAKDCPFYYVTRYSGSSSTAASGTKHVHTSRGNHQDLGSSTTSSAAPQKKSLGARVRSPPSSSTESTNLLAVSMVHVLTNGGAQQHRPSRLPPIADGGISKTLSFVVSRELNTQMKLVDEAIAAMESAWAHPLPLLNAFCPIAPEVDKSFADMKPTMLQASLGIRSTVATVPQFVVDARGDPNLVRRHVMKQALPFMNLPVVVTCPKNWFSADTLTLIQMDLQRHANHARDSVASFCSDDASSLFSPLGSSQASSSPLSAVSKKFGSGLSPERALMLMNQLFSPPESQFTPVVVVDARGFLTKPGLFVVLRRESINHPTTVRDTRTWLLQCYRQGRQILEEPVGSLVEPKMQQRHLDVQAEKRDEDELRTEWLLEALGKEDWTTWSRARKAQRRAQRRAAQSKTTGIIDDFGADTSLDRLVDVCYQNGSAVRHAEDPPLADEQLESHRRLITLQRRSVKRFGLRILRSWIRFHLGRLHRQEMMIDLLQKNAMQHMRRRFLIWFKFASRRRAQVSEVRHLAAKSTMAHLRRRFQTWKVAHLSRAVAKNFNAWLFDAAYHRWLFIVCKKRVDRILSDATRSPTLSPKGAGRYLSAIQQLGHMTRTKRLTTFLDFVVALPAGQNESSEEVA